MANQTAVQAKEPSPIIEVVTLKLKSGVTAAQFESVDQEIQTNYMEKRSGFLSRESAPGSDNHFAQIRASVVHEAKIANKLKCKGSIVWKCNLHCFLRCVSLGQDLPQLGSSGFPYDSAVARGRRVRSAAGAASSAKKVMHRTGHPSPRNRYTWCHGRHEADKRYYRGPYTENMGTLRGFDS